MALGSRTYSLGKFADLRAVPQGTGPWEGLALIQDFGEGQEDRWFLFRPLNS